MARVCNALIMVAALSIAYAAGRVKGHEEAFYAVAVGKVSVEVEKDDKSN